METVAHLHRWNAYEWSGGRNQGKWIRKFKKKMRNERGEREMVNDIRPHLTIFNRNRTNR